MIDSICTITDRKSYKDFVLLYKSLRKFYPTMPIYVAADRYVADRIWEPIGGQIELFDENIFAEVIVPEALPPRDPTNHKDPNWLALMCLKMGVMETALSKHDNIMFVDSDLVFLNPITGIDLGVDVALSPHHIQKSQEDAYGRYNGGCVFTSCKSFPEWWRRAVERSTFYEQQCLTLACEAHIIQELGMEHDFGWYRIEHSPPEKKQERIDGLCTNEFGSITYANQPLVSIHTHFFDDRPECRELNAIILRCMKYNDRYSEIYNYIKIG